MGNAEQILNTSSQNVFAQPLLDQASLLDNTPLSQLQQTFAQQRSASASNGIVFDLDPTALPQTQSANEPITAKSTVTPTPLIASPTVFGRTAATVPLTNQPGVDPLTGAPQVQVQSAAIAAPTLPDFAIMTEGTVTISGNSDFDGINADLNDDAFIYAGRGFTITGTTELPIQRDASGAPVLNAQGQPVLRQNAVAVSSGYTASTVSGNNRYAGLNPPPIVATQTITVPAYATVRQQELDQRIPAGATPVVLNVQQNRIQNANDWNRLFPMSGTVTQPRVVRVTNGDLVIPNQVTLSNAIVLVENGNINFSGNNQQFNNVVLVANAGEITLGNVQATQFSALASGRISTGNNAKFDGATLIASNSDIAFNGSTKDTSVTQDLRIIAQGDLTYSASANTRGSLMTAKELTFSGNTSLLGTIKAKGNLRFTGRSSVVAVAAPDRVAPTITAALERDTASGGTTNTDRLTSDPTIVGQAIDTSTLTQFRAGLDDTTPANFVSILPQRQTDGSFRLTRSQLEQINGGVLTDGFHTLKLQATDSSGNTSSVFELTFTLDTAAPTISSPDLATSSDSGRSNTDNITNVSRPRLEGTAEANSIVRIYQNNQQVGQTTATASGSWQYESAPLTTGQYSFTTTVEDAAGNLSAVSSPLLVTVKTSIAPPTNLDLLATSDSGQSNSDNLTNQAISVIGGQAEAGSTVQLYRATQLLGETTATSTGTWQITTAPLSRGTNTLSAIAIDVAGNTSSASSPLTIVLDDEQPTLAVTTPLNSPITQATRLAGRVDGTGSSIASAIYFFDGGTQQSLTIDAAGNFNQAINLTGILNGNRVLTIVSTDFAGNVRTTQFNVSVAVDREAPTITATLVRDTALDNQTNQDRITFDPTIAGTVTDSNTIAVFQARFNAAAPWVNILPQRQSNGSFTLTRSQLNLINGAPLADGAYTLQLQATDEFGFSNTFGLAFTLDTTIAPPTIQLNAASDGGNNAADRITRNTTPTLSGTTEPGARVQLFEGTTSRGQTTATAQGVWQITTSVLANGSHTLSAIATDLAGNQSEAASFELRVDTDGSFNQSFNFTGIANGNYTLTLTARDIAGNIGSTSYLINVEVDREVPVIAAQLLQDTGRSSTDKITSNAEVTGTITDRNRITVFRAGFNAAPESAFVDVSTLVQPNGQFSLNLGQLQTIYGGVLPDGTHTLKLQAQDQFGNLSSVFSLTFTLDTTRPGTPTLDLPEINDSGVSNTDNLTRNPVTITGSAEIGSLVEIAVNGTPTTSISSNGTWSVTLGNLAEGSQTVTAAASDVAGNTSQSASLPLQIDSLAPTLDVSSIASNATLVTNSRLVGQVNGTGSVITQLVYFFDNKTPINLPVSSNGQFDVAIDYQGLQTGSHTLNLVATDRSGNVQSLQFTVTLNLDLIAPLLNIGLANDTAPNGVNNDRITSDATIRGSVTDASGISSLQASFETGSGATFVDILPQLNNGQFTLSKAVLAQINGGALPDGTYALRVRSQDLFGNSREVVLEFTLDTKAPRQPGFSLAPNSDTGVIGDSRTSRTVVQLLGLTERDAIVRFGQSEISTQANSEGEFIAGQYTLNGVTLAPGENVFTVEAFDRAGNRSVFTQTIVQVANDSSDVIIDWNATALRAIQFARTAPPRAVYNLAILHGAMFDAVNAIERQFQIYNVDAPVSSNTSAIAAAAAAAHRILTRLYPTQASFFDAQLTASLAGVPDGVSENQGVALGRFVADAALNARQGDGANVTVAYQPGTNPGEWQPTGNTLLGFPGAALPQWAQVRPFALATGNQFRPDGPPELDSAEYAAELNQVKALGAKTNSTRTETQTEVAEFWSDGAGTYSPPGHWNQIAQTVSSQRGNSLLENARTFALLNVGLADAGIAAWDAKYAYNFWRPETAIRRADEDNNPATIADPNWQSFLVTPNHPDYVSGHSTFSGTAATILSSIFGDTYSFNSSSLGLPGIYRNFESFDAAAEEAGISRIYGGIHYQSANQDGLALGRQVGQYVVDRLFRPITRSELQAGLANDTAPQGATNQDGITTDATIRGSIAASAVGTVTLSVGLDDAPLTSYQNLTNLLQADGTFTITTAQLASLAGGTLIDGQYSVNLRIVDANGLVLATQVVRFKLDQTAPTVDLQSPIADAGYSDTARVIGRVLDANGAATSARYSIDGQPLQALPVNAQGRFDQRLVPSSLAVGAHTLVLETRDIAGNIRQTTVGFTVKPNLTATGSGNAGWAVQTSDGIVLAEGSSFKTQASVSVPLGQTTGTRTLSFNVTPNFDLQDANATIQDRLLVYLIDPQNPSQTLLNMGEPGTPVFALAGRSAEFIPGLVTYNGTTVTIDVSSLANRTEGLLVFQLINNDGDTRSTVRISDLNNEVDSNGISSPVLPPTIVRGTQGGSIVDFSTFAPADKVELLVSNVHLDTATGRYVADLRVRNTGTTPVSRNLAILFSQLPQGVSVIGASGIHPAGSPYLNLATVLPPGDLAPGIISPTVQVVFNNPDSIQFDLQPVVLAGRLDQPPTLASLGNLTVEAGGRLEIPLEALDPDGNRVTLSMRPNDNLPTGRLLANGRLIFTPSPEQVGTYTFTLVAKSGNLETTQDVTLTVTDDASTTTRVSGSVLSTDQAPLGGILVEVNGWQAITDSMGRFTIELPYLPPNDTLKIYADRLTGSVVYPFIAEKLPLVLEHEVYQGVNNVIARPIYLPPLDVANGVAINPTQDTVVTTPNLPGASVTVKAGTLFDKNGNPFVNKLSITAVPPDLTPAALPDTLRPGLVVTIQPGDMVFDVPAPLTLPNVEGYAPGSDMDLWSINPITGVFDRVGLARVSADGSVIETIEGGIRNSSWHFVAPPPPICPNGPQSPDCGCKECEDGAPFTSVVSTKSGGLTETHSLVTYESLGESRGVQLVYDSLRADARPILRYDFTGIPNWGNVVVTADLTIKGKDFSYQVPGFSGNEIGVSSGQHFWKVPSNSSQSGMTIALQADLRDRASGRYKYTSMTGSQGNVLVTIPGFGSRSIFVGSLGRYEGNLINVNTINSNFGSGWGIAGVQELVENVDGSILLIDGDGSELIYEKFAPTGEYISAPGDFSKLVRLADGRFQRTMEDKTVYTFNANNRLVSVVDRRGRTTQHVYNPAGQLTKVIDPAGLETVMSYNAGGKLTEIKDPANRITQLEYDAQGNLTRITDPDNSARTFEYDDGHRMTAEIDQRGFREEAFYNFAGRAVRAIRKDGSEVQLSLSETVGLYRPEDTINPFNAPTALRGNNLGSTYVDANGNVKSIALDGAGQVVSSQDGIGQGSSSDRNTQNLVTQSRDARGNLTSYTYDERGNATNIVEYLNNPLDPDPSLLTFDYGQPIYANNDVAELRAVDVNSDGNADLITLEQNGDIIIRIGSNDGAFTELNTSVTNEAALSLETGDINGDGNVDFVVSTIDNITSEVKAKIFLNNGRGEFTLRNSINLGVNNGNQKTVADSVSLADVNNDRILDLVYRQKDRLVARTGRENGDFSAALNSEIALDSFDEIELGSGYGAEIVQTLAIEDVDRDGNADIVALQRSGFAVMTGNGRGVFTPSYFYQLPDPSSPDTMNLLGGLKLADINGDNRLDLLVSDSSAGNLLTFLGDGTATFQNPLSYEIDEDLGQIQTADLNRDGFLDVVVASQDYGYHVVMGAGNGTYVRQFTEYGGAAQGIAIADINNDRGLDLITVGSSSSYIDVWLSARSDKRVERSYTYDSIFNKVTSEIDELGRKTLYEIDSLTGNMLSVTRVMGQLDAVSRETDDLITRYTYLEDGQVDTMTDALDRVTDYDYSALGQLVKVTYAKGTIDEAFESYEYDLAGNRTAIVDANGNRTEYEYDARNRLVREIQADPDGVGSQSSPIIEYQYDAAGNQIEVKDARGFITENVYDEMGRLVKLIQPDPDGSEPLSRSTTTMEYDRAGNQSVMVDALGRRTEYRYDQRNRLSEIINPDGTTIKRTYNLDNQVIAIRDEDNHLIRRQYDSRGRLIRTIDALNFSTIYKYDDANQLISIEDANGRITNYRYDDAGRQTQVVDARGKSTYMTYDKVGNLTTTLDQLYRESKFFYDNLNRLVRSEDALNQSTTYTYDAFGNQLSVTDALNRTKYFTYDQLNRLVLTTEVNQSAESSAKENGISQPQHDGALSAQMPDWRGARDR